MKKITTLALVLATTLVNAQFNTNLLWKNQSSSVGSLPESTRYIANEEVMGMAISSLNGDVFTVINSHRKTLGGGTSDFRGKVIRMKGNDGTVFVNLSYNKDNPDLNYMSLKDIAHDENGGNVIIAGQFEGTFDPNFYGFTNSLTTLTSTTYMGNASIFLAQYDDLDLTFKWGKKINFNTSMGKNFTVARVKVNPANGDIFVLGTANTTTTTTTYLAKYNKIGTAIWTKTIGATANTGSVYANDLTLDASGNAYIVGAYGGGANFGSSVVLTGGTAGSTNELNTYFAKYNSSGTIQYAKKVSTKHYDTDKKRILIDRTRVLIFSEYSRATVINNTISYPAINGAILWAKYQTSNGTFLSTSKIYDSSRDHRPYALNDVGADFNQNIYVCYGADDYSTVFAKYKRSSSGTSYTLVGKDGTTAEKPDGMITGSIYRGFVKTRIAINLNPIIGFQLSMVSNHDRRLILDYKSNGAPVYSVTPADRGCETIYAKFNQGNSTSGRIGSFEEEETEESFSDERLDETSLSSNTTQVNIFPNPTTDNIQVNLANREEPANVTIIDVTGRIVKQIANYTNTSTIELDELTPGSYIITIQQGEIVVRKQVLKQ